MKKSRFAILALFPIILASCSSVMDDNVLFMNKNNVTLCYFGKENNVLNKVSHYYDLSSTEFPNRENVDSFFVTVIDVNNKRDDLSAAFLNEIYESLKWDCYSYIAFFNFDHSLHFLRNSKFGDLSLDYTDISDTMILQNDATSLIQCLRKIYTFTSESDYNYNNYFTSAFTSVATEVQLDLRDQ